ncbi:LOW QUALITY PROTEIN: receptor-like protein kinase HERK 1 [Dioscorea cayenensis subsp. rotundata]|uniref:LOW QUALITY PROTEIN: receptor-like protein kinase HERK 1 n=1 Tax=Dioscorea cayennensis subsp. rotundata TaxID=55577 RepID=A0AB40BNW1_DIOCR|nr:LOW QUALITY PROTEIN: receptor-like protein kinase HERK 1 [Dioscorea cayenensis subsp. rotundata]
MAARNLQQLFLFAMVIICLVWFSNAYNPVDNYLINCGSSSSKIIGSRNFSADISLSWTLTAPKSIMANTSSNSVSSFDTPALYETARIFTGASSYTFPIKRQGRHFVRLYFFPFIYQNINLTSANFTVSTQDIVLIYGYPTQEGATAVRKEYSVNIAHDQLIISFAPLSNTSLAFVNAIEVVSVPSNLINDTATIVNPQSEYQGLSEQAFETVYRINMGGPYVGPENDTLWRIWVPDKKFILNEHFAVPKSYSGSIFREGGETPEIAPDVIYNTATELAPTNTSIARFNVTWQFDADAGSTYFLRLHFCDIVSNALFELYFDIYINTYMAVSDVDLSTINSNMLAAACYMDFVMTMTDSSSNLTVSIGPSNLPNVLPDGILNGLEILKMRSNGNVTVVSPPSSKADVGVIVGAVIGGALAVVIVVACVVCIMIRRKKAGKKQPSKTWSPLSINGIMSQSLGSGLSDGTNARMALNANFGFRFSISALQEATNNFDESCVIGVGGFGKVYKGVLKDDTEVAVKRGNPKSQQGLNEFHTEIELLSRLRHRHLVSLIGYCDERNEMILVYEYMENGTLKNHLYGSNLPALSWKQRLEVCIGSARGLHYLHTGQAKAVIHRDVKSANILLDKNLMAKVADFGLSKAGPELDQTHVSTAVKGSFGYLDPEYYRRQQLTDKSDVYSFGVVLLEVLCARPVIDPTLPREMVNLAEWAIKYQNRGELDQIVDSRIARTIRPDSLRKFGETVEKCLADCGVDRPAMGDVLWNLEYVLQLQEVDGGTEVNSINRISGLPTQMHHMSMFESETVHESGTSDSSDVSMSKVFSQLFQSQGR